MFDFLKKLQKNKDVQASPEKPKESDFIIDHMKNMAAAFMEEENYDRAFDTYSQIIDLKYDTDSFYNLGTLCALGRGTDQDFLKAAQYFKKAQMLGDDSAEKMLIKSTLDYINQIIASLDDTDAYDAMIKYANAVEPDEVAKKVVVEKLIEYGGYQYNKRGLNESLKAYRIGAVCAKDAQCCYNIGVIYYNGRLIVPNMAAVLYWMDKAADLGMDEARETVRSIIERCVKEDYDMVELLNEIVVGCTDGSDAVPKDNSKVDYWASIRNSY